NGAEVAYLGLDGPMGNASHAFHWLLEDGRKELGWNAQSYAFGDGPFHQAKLVVVYDLSSPWYQRQAAALQTWVQQGGRVLLWDVSPAASPFLEGIRFQHDSSYMPPGYVAFDQTRSPLNGQLAGKKFDLDPGCMEPADIVEFSAAWHELAYTVRESQNIEQIQWGYETFGPRWTSLLNSSRRPLFLVRNFGSGEVAVATLGSCNVLPQAGVKPGQSEQAPLFLPTLVRDILLWAQAR